VHFSHPETLQNVSTSHSSHAVVPLVLTNKPGWHWMQQKNVLAHISPDIWQHDKTHQECARWECQVALGSCLVSCTLYASEYWSPHFEHCSGQVPDCFRSIHMQEVQSSYFSYSIAQRGLLTASCRRCQHCTYIHPTQKTKSVSKKHNLPYKRGGDLLVCQSPTNMTFVVSNLDGCCRLHYVWTKVP